MKWSYRICSFFMVFFLTSLNAEVISTAIVWDAARCDSRCAQRFQNLLSRMQQFTSVDFDGDTGKAVLYWRPKQTLTPYVFRQISMNNVIFLQQVDVVIRGTISRMGNRYFMNSIGDLSKVEIFSLAKVPPHHEDHRKLFDPYNKSLVDVVTTSPSPVRPTYNITKKMAERLTDVMKSDKLITLTGTLVDPFSPQLQMLISEEAPFQ